MPQFLSILQLFRKNAKLNSFLVQFIFKFGMQPFLSLPHEKCKGVQVEKYLPSPVNKISLFCTEDSLAIALKVSTGTAD